MKEGQHMRMAASVMVGIVPSVGVSGNFACE